MTHGSYIVNHDKLFFPWVVGRIDSRPGGAAVNKGFTLVELIIVMAIIGILATLSIPTYNGYINTTRNRRAMSEIRTLNTEISGYALDKGTNPPDLNAINRPNYKDPWKRNYVYYNFAAVPPQLPLLPAAQAPLEDPYSKLNTDYDLYSLGIDGLTAALDGDPANLDDIVRFNDGTYVGMRVQP